MKMVMICYNEAIDDEVMELLDACALANYTKVMGVFGKGTGSGTHLGNDIWPGRNNVLYVACDDAAAERLLQGVRGLRSEYREEGIKAFCWNLEEMT
ncbi:MAG: hypothetical protein NTX71_11270 [Candidatus Aureabacteria bacterium]|nr:hypothetical protein [Candidatus Auribacterota bacterium]